MSNLTTLDTRPAATAPDVGDDLDHLYCCDPTRAFCGANLDEWAEDFDDDGPTCCVVCYYYIDNGLDAPCSCTGIA